MRAKEFITESGKITGPYKLLSIDHGTVSLEGHGPLKLDDAVTDNLKPGYNYAFEVNGDLVTKVILMVVDTVVYTDRAVLMIKRQNDPYSGHWALPGGFIDPGETPAQAAIRELQEETGLTVDSVKPVGEFKTPGRDPRMKHTWSYAFKLPVAQPEKVQAGDDASAAKWIPLDKLNQLPLAFDHDQIIKLALSSRLSANQ